MTPAAGILQRTSGSGLKITRRLKYTRWNRAECESVITSRKKLPENGTKEGKNTENAACRRRKSDVPRGTCDAWRICSQQLGLGKEGSLGDIHGWVCRGKKYVKRESKNLIAFKIALQSHRRKQGGI